LREKGKRRDEEKRVPRPSEFDLIARHFAPLAGPGAFGLTDDAAALPQRAGRDLVLTTDMIVAGVHFFADDPPASIAVKALGVNLSDLAAKGAEPGGFLLGLALPPDIDDAWLADFARGLGDVARAHACPLTGGDTVSTAGPLTVSVTAFGHVPAGRMVRRTSARPGDALLVSGTIGDAALGLRLRLEPEGTLAKALPAALSGHLHDRYLRPRPRGLLAPALLAHARAAMDVSDGLAGDAFKMAGGLGLDVALGALPLSDAARAALAHDPSLIETVATGGDDYEVLAAVDPGEVTAFRRAADAAGVPVTEIGRFGEPGGARRLVGPDGREARFGRLSHVHG
jgi:thiamine-monophosphate kinase